MLAGFAVWGTLAGSGPFDRDDLNESFLLLLTFMIGVTVPSLALSADVAVRRRTEDELRAVHDDLNRRVAARTAELTDANLRARSTRSIAASAPRTCSISRPET